MVYFKIRFLHKISGTHKLVIMIILWCYIRKVTVLYTCAECVCGEYSQCIASCALQTLNKISAFNHCRSKYNVIKYTTAKLDFIYPRLWTYNSYWEIQPCVRLMPFSITGNRCNHSISKCYTPMRGWELALQLNQTFPMSVCNFQEIKLKKQWT